MRRSAICAAALAATWLSSGAEKSGSAPTFTKDIAPILYRNCVGCHRTGDIAPMELISYQQVRPWAAALKESVVKRTMPPWFADPAHGKFRNDRRLSSEQIATIVAWVNAGAPKGDDRDLPARPKFVEGWSLSRPPDLVIEMPLDAKVPATGQMDLQNYYVKAPVKEDVFIEAIELRPGNRRVVHHSIANIVDLPEGLAPESLLSGKKLGPTGWKLVGQAPGKGALQFLPGTAKRISAGAYIEFNMHYTPTGKDETDRSSLGLWFAKYPVTHEVVSRPAREETYIDGKKVTRVPNIPPNVDNWEIVAKMNVRDDITIYAVSPHMHFRGKDMKYTARRPDGTEEVLLNVPRYNYEWQLNYEFETPVKLPAGSTITVLSHYDNSANNPRNPAPNEEVIWGQQSWNEMFIPWMEYSVDKLDLTKLSKEELMRLRAPRRAAAIQ